MRKLTVLLLWLPGIVLAEGMGDADARHLLSRTGFAPTATEIREFAALSRTQAVDRLLATVRTEPITPMPAGINDFMPLPKLRAMRQNATEEERKRFVREQIEKGLALRAWWLQEMRVTDSPLTERMTLFWHNHFVSSQQKVKSTALLARQNLLLRRHAVGNFGELLHAVARDPAMVVYLDNVSNRKGQPNENFAREVMELFTLGEGHYSEQDIREAARAFTGWSLDRNTGDFRFYRVRHDAGEKTVLGQRGRFNGDEVLDLLLAQPATAEFITAKLWREFVSPQPDPQELKRIANRFRDSRYDLRTVLRDLLTSEHFYAPGNRAVLVKSPVDLVVGTLRLFDIHPQDLRPAALATRNLGQDLLNPPNVKGWPGGEAWINSQTLLARRQLLSRLFRAEEMPGAAAAPAGDPQAMRLHRRGLQMTQDYRFQAQPWFSQFRGTAAQRQADMTRLVLATAPYEHIDASLETTALLSALVLDPVYQLK